MGCIYWQLFINITTEADPDRWGLLSDDAIWYYMKTGFHLMIDSFWLEIGSASFSSVFARFFSYRNETRVMFMCWPTAKLLGLECYQDVCYLFL